MKRDVWKQERNHGYVPNWGENQVTPRWERPGTPRPTIYKWLFQLDDSQSLHRKWLEITKHPFINMVVWGSRQEWIWSHNFESHVTHVDCDVFFSRSTHPATCGKQRFVGILNKKCTVIILVMIGIRLVCLYSFSVDVFFVSEIQNYPP